MSFWTNKDHPSYTDTVDDLANGPSGGRGTQWFAGVVLALIPIIYGIVCINRGWTPLWGRNSPAMILRGTESIILASSYIAAGFFLHFHYFWGLHRRLFRYSQVLKSIALMAFLSCFLYTLWEIISWGNPWQ